MPDPLGKSQMRPSKHGIVAPETPATGPPTEAGQLLSFQNIKEVKTFLEQCTLLAANDDLSTS